MQGKHQVSASVGFEGDEDSGQLVALPLLQSLTDHFRLLLHPFHLLLLQLGVFLLQLSSVLLLFAEIRLALTFLDPVPKGLLDVLYLCHYLIELLVLEFILADEEGLAHIEFPHPQLLDSLGD